MQMLFCTRKLRALFTGIAIAISANAGAETAALAQDTAADTAAPSSSAVPDGHIVYSRDVPYGSAIGPRTPGQPHTVNAGPTALILDSLAAGLEPIGDDENASIVAGTSLQTGQVGAHVAQGMSALSSMTGADGSASSLGDIQNSATGSAISRATGAIGSAMGSLRGVLGNGLAAANPGGGQ